MKKLKFSDIIIIESEKRSRKESTMDCKYCGYCWADVNEDGEPESLEYCHFDGPEGWAPCEYVEYDEYTDEAYVDAQYE